MGTLKTCKHADDRARDAAGRREYRHDDDASNPRQAANRDAHVTGDERIAALSVVLERAVRVWWLLGRLAATTATVIGFGHVELQSGHSENRCAMLHYIMSIKTGCSK